MFEDGTFDLPEMKVALANLDLDTQNLIVDYVMQSYEVASGIGKLLEMQRRLEGSLDYWHREGTDVEMFAECEKYFDECKILLNKVQADIVLANQYGNKLKANEIFNKWLKDWEDWLAEETA